VSLSIFQFASLSVQRALKTSVPHGKRNIGKYTADVSDCIIFPSFLLVSTVKVKNIRV